MIDPQAARVLQTLEDGAADESSMDDAAWVAAYRKQLRGMARFQQPPAPVDVRDLSAGAIRLRMYRANQAYRSPALIWFHGGGFIGGGLDTHDAPLRDLARRAAWTIIAVDYALAPEAAFPRAHEDCYAALQHVHAHVHTLAVNPHRIVLGGDSCGGLLAVAVAMMARDRHGPPVAGCVALYPNADLREDRSYPSMAEHDGKVVKLAELHRGLRLFMRDADRADAYASPALARDLGRLPRTLLATCEDDPLRDEGEFLAARMAEAGTSVEHTRYPGMIHGFFQMAGAIDAADALYGQLKRTLLAF
jgi:acetyl esterase